MKRRSCLALLASGAFGSFASAHARSNVTPQQFLSIGAGRYEFPISGSFRFYVEGEATVFESPDRSRKYYVGSFNNVFAAREAPSQERIRKLEPVVKASWERFATSENGVIQAPFHQTVLPLLTVFSMATEFNERNGLQYYVQYAATDGRSVGTVFAEGLGPAVPVHEELLPVILQVKMAGGT